MTDRPLTGGSSGIGYELAAQLAHRGYDVAISGQSERVHDSAKELEALGVEAYPFRADAATYDGVEGFWTFVATDSEFHANAGMGDTVFGDNSWKNDRTEVARQGIEALFAGDDHVVGGDDATKQQVVDNRASTEPEKAARQGELAHPS